MTVDRDDAWRFCVAVSTGLYEECTRDPSFEAEISRLYQKWRADPAGTSSKVRILTSLALYSLILDRPSSVESDWKQITGVEILNAVVSRPIHELFVSLPRFAEEEEGHVQALKLMSYGFGTVSGPSTSVNYWAYLTTLVGLFLEQIARATSEDSPTCETILNTGGQEATPVEGSG